MAQRRLEVPVVRVDPGETPRETTDLVAGEAPLRVRVGGHDLGVLLRTPGEDDALTLGFLLSEGVLRAPEDAAEIRVCRGPRGGGPTVEVTPDAGVEVDPARWLRTGLIGSGCGHCGREMIGAVLGRAPARPPVRPGPPPPELIRRLRARQPLFEATGGTHAAGLFEADGTLVAAAEDVGRHNAVDKALGAVALAGRWPPPPVLVTTSRGSFDILQKAAVTGVGAVVLASAPSALAVQLAVGAGIYLAGFVRAGRWVVYAEPGPDA